MPTTKYGIPYVTSSHVLSTGPGEINAGLDAIDSKMAGYSSGPLASRPTSTVGTPGIAGRRYRATDTAQEFIDTGTSWVQIALEDRGASLIATAESIASGSIGDLTTVGPTVTINVPDLGGGVGMVEILAQAQIAPTSSAVGKVFLYEDAAQVGALLQGDAANTLTVISAPGSVTGVNSRTAGLQFPGGMVARAVTPGSHTYKLRYIATATGSATFSNRLLIARALG